MCSFKLCLLIKECLCEAVYISFRKVSLADDGSLYRYCLCILFNTVVCAGGDGVCRIERVISLKGCNMFIINCQKLKLLCGTCKVCDVCGGSTGCAEECINLAVEGAKMIIDRINEDKSGTKFILEYSPEAFSDTELDFSVKICDAVLDCWKPTPENKVIINLPETVEYQTANVYADQIEYFCRNTKWRDSIIISLHTHNDSLSDAVIPEKIVTLYGQDYIYEKILGAIFL